MQEPGSAVCGDYLTRQRCALATALRQGRGKRSYQLAEHLAAEGGVHRSDVLAATTLLLACRAVRDGDTEAASRFTRRLRGLDKGSVELVHQLMWLETGREQGWLPRARYDALLAYAQRENRFDLVRRAGSIQAREDAPSGWWADLEHQLGPWN
ncbi:hypothetical protein ATK36_4767 [Amycolatopsis sulphurea]|uniref:Uncharacterized protein n=1 Tax=Amycolatopsis sulphurea TaxID=76022 RepID=A0A2A9FDT3_9PSEU|nr:hypothetical protein [Amycolatopsis sulphurea]PFG49607.1 hypothetical protein ATK36_4767 [Amycolatopsis sulphurea]